MDTTGNVCTTATEKTVSGDVTEAQTPHPEEHLYQVAYDFFMYVDPVILLVGLIGNTLSLIVMQRPSVKDSPVSVILSTLAIVDILVLVLDFLNNYLKYYLSTYLLGYKGFCEFHRYMFNVVYTTSGWMIVLVTCERFIVVWYPLKAKILCTKKKATAAIVVTVALICVFYLYNLWAYVVNEDGECDEKSHMDYFMQYVSPWLTAVAYSYVPLTIIIILNICIIYKLRKAKESLGKVTGVKKDENYSRKVTVTVLAVCVSYTLLTVPVTLWYIVLFAEESYLQRGPRIALAEIIVLTIGLCNYATNFFLYVITSDRFRHELKDMLCCRNKPNRTQNPGWQSSDSLSDVTPNSNSVSTVM